MRLLLFSDAVALLVASIVAAAVSDLGRPLPSAAWVAVMLPLSMILFAARKLYERDRQQISVSGLNEVPDVFTALGLVGFATLAVTSAGSVTWLVSTNPLSVVWFWVAGTLLVPSSRALLRHKVVPRVTAPKRTVVLGAGKVGQTISRKIRHNPQYNIELVGFLDDDPPPLALDLSDMPVLGPERDLVKTIRDHHVTRVILAFSRSTHEEVLELVRAAGLQDVHISIVPRYFEIIAANVGVSDVEGISVLELPAAGLSRFARATKRTFDLCLAIPALIILSPLFLVLAIAIKLESPGPAFFRQTRTGRNGNPFEIIKFRTMVVGAETMRSELAAENEALGPLFKIRVDPRVTRVGRVARRFSLDELPQLINVIAGQMSLVGPRPFVTYEDSKIAGWARRRLDLTPGITGFWQVLGRNDIEYDEMVKLDYLYVTNWSLWWDTKLLLRTIPIVLGRRGY